MRPVERDVPELLLVRVGADANRDAFGACPRGTAKSPTAIATRYVDIFGDVANVSVCRSGAGPGVSDSRPPFEMAVSPRSMVSRTAKVALNAGSSKHGNARRASVDSNCVTA